MKTLAGELAFNVGLPGFQHQLQLVPTQELAETLRSKICLVDLMCMYMLTVQGAPLALAFGYWVLL